MSSRQAASWVHSHSSSIIVFPSYSNNWSMFVLNMGSSCLPERGLTDESLPASVIIVVVLLLELMVEMWWEESTWFWSFPTDVNSKAPWEDWMWGNITEVSWESGRCFSEASVEASFSLLLCFFNSSSKAPCVATRAAMFSWIVMLDLSCKLYTSSSPLGKSHRKFQINAYPKQIERVPQSISISPNDPNIGYLLNDTEKHPVVHFLRGKSLNVR